MIQNYMLILNFVKEKIINIWKHIDLQRSWNLRPKPDFAVTFWAILFMISFEDLILIFYVWVSNTTIEGGLKMVQYEQHFATTFRHLTKEIMVLVYHNIFFVYLTVLAPHDHCATCPCGWTLYTTYELMWV